MKNILPNFYDSSGKSNLPIGSFSNQPKNLNFQEGTAFRLSIKKIPNVIFFCKSVNLPGISISKVEQSTQFNPLLYPGGIIQTEDLSVNFQVSEDLENWKEIYKWIRSCSTYKDYNDIVDLDKSLASDGTLFILSSKNNINLTVNFTNLFPISLNSLEFDYSDTEIVPLNCSVSFAYSYYDLT
jgi:hypothetical protein